MSRQLNIRSASGGTTDHGTEIRELREAAAAATRNGSHAAAILADAAADLLAAHDESGISLDYWTGPRNLVNLALSRYTTAGTFTPNGI